ncbi:MAG: zf-HC2 domain-containing protein [Pseudomonadota bacterium]|nr:zf-HC2 domain-containing protein [Pseudomonadota bacterium]
MLSCKEVSHLASDHLDNPPRGWAGLQFKLHLMICGPCRRFRQHLATSRDTAARLARQLWQEDNDTATRILDKIDESPGKK